MYFFFSFYLVWTSLVKIQFPNSLFDLLTLNYFLVIMDFVLFSLTFRVYIQGHKEIKFVKILPSYLFLHYVLNFCTVIALLICKIYIDWCKKIVQLKEILEDDDEIYNTFQKNLKLKRMLHNFESSFLNLKDVLKEGKRDMFWKE